MQSESLTFKYDESSNTSSSSCVNITIIDDNVPENELYITVGLSVAFNDLGAVFVVPEENETVIDIIDDDHGTLNRSKHWDGAHFLECMQRSICKWRVKNLFLLKWSVFCMA